MLVWVLSGFVLATAGCSGRLSDAHIVYLDDARFQQAVLDRAEGTLLIDARSPDAFAAGTIPGAVNVQLRDVPVEEVRRRFAGYSRIIVFGQNPGSPRAAALSKRLLAGRVSVETYLPGYERWRELRSEGAAQTEP